MLQKKFNLPKKNGENWKNCGKLKERRKMKKNEQGNDYNLKEKLTKKRKNEDNNRKKGQ